MNVGDLIELSEYGFKITENKYFRKKVGIVQEIKATAHFEFNYIVRWFGILDKPLMQSDHPKRDLKALTNQKQ